MQGMLPCCRFMHFQMQCSLQTLWKPCLMMSGCFK